MLCTAVSNETHLSAVVDDRGTTQRKTQEHLRQQGATPNDRWYDEVEVPSAGNWLWELFWKLSDRRARDGMSGIPHPITYLEIDAYQRLTRTRLSRLELQALEGMDAAHLNAALKTRRGE